MAIHCVIPKKSKVPRMSIVVEIRTNERTTAKYETINDALAFYSKLWGVPEDELRYSKWPYRRPKDGLYKIRLE